MENFRLGGVSLLSWLTMYNDFAKTNQWPDGRAYLEQPNLTVDVFTTIESQLNAEHELKLKSGGG